MAISGGPDIVEDGLVLHLDAADKNSYPGTGSTWYDLSGNDNHVTLYNSPSFVGDKYGAFYFDGTNDYGLFASDLLTGNDTLASTVEITSYRTRTNAFEVMFGGGLPSASGNASNHTYFGFRNYDNALMYAYWGNDLDVSTATTNIAWHHYVATQANTSTTYGDRQSFIDGRRIGYQSLRKISRNTYYAIGGFLQNGNISYYFRGNIQSFKLYNRVLSDDEIIENYNATKGRYGL
jgi:hypothetical protein